MRLLFAPPALGVRLRLAVLLVALFFCHIMTLMATVLALVVATVPSGSVSATGIAIGYGVSLVIGLFVLFRK